MKDIIQWSKDFNPNQKPWLMLGKGPSFQRLHEVDIQNFFTCSLNHVVRELPVTLAHIIDIDVVKDCAEEIDLNARFLLLPYKPHVNHNPCKKTIQDFLAEMPVLQKLEKENRLLWYNLSSSNPMGKSPVIKAVFFSAEAALNVLAICGVKTIRSLGIDGGSTYSGRFQDLNNKTLLANGHKSFNRQFEGICETLRKNPDLLYAPYFMEAPIRVFVGTDAPQMMGVKLLEYSIKKFTPVTTIVKPLDDREISIPREPKNRARTGFSFCRFHIPRLCGYRGRAIYMDADMQVFTDLSKLWTWPMEQKRLLYCQQPPERKRIPQFSVMLMNCEALLWDVHEIVRGLDDGRYTYEQLMRTFCILADEHKKMDLPFEWNSLEHYEEGKTCLIHYTDMPTQPWVSHENPNGEVWYKIVKEAVQEGFITEEELYAEIEKEHLSPELPRWVGLDNPKEFKNLIKTWIPPYKRFTGMNGFTSGMPSGIELWWSKFKHLLKK